MPDYDAFGREISESAPSVPSAPARPASPAPSPSPIPASARIRRREQRAGRGARGGRRGRGVTGAVVAFTTLGVVAVVGLVAVGGAVREGIDTLPDVSSLTVPGVAPVAPDDPAPAPRGLAPRSLITAAELRPALRRLRAAGSRARYLRLAPDRIDAQLVSANGRARQVQLGPEGPPRTLSTTGAGGGGAPTVTLAALDAGAPARLVRRASARSGAATRNVDYLVAQVQSGRVRWLVFFKDGGPAFLADARGRIVQKLR